ncbi:threonine-phosphate decarboxylase CobD [Bradyrhizobium sp. SZCCHNPS2010]|uniref:threonine-phosphate decarboxylase CobD n=1 Tax=Bradyrhizobium sp. SZCCHNPS2010 TaxID=3057333 RepID=UPI002916543A|nr:threonine-phosphate decarboxylase CobD [Bradyrhizobium sp. SZCCHNPS2010]
MDHKASSTRGIRPEAVAHGGNIDEISRRYPDAPQPWVDLSTGINPIAYPLPRLAAEAWTRLPTNADERTLLAAAAARYGLRGPASVIAAPGTQALLQIIPRLRSPGTVAVLGPTYEEHALCWHRCGHRVRTVNEVEALAEADVAVVVNPNNPTGRLLPRETLVSLGSELARRDGLLIVDEAFADFLPGDASLTSRLPPATIVLRSFGKAYGFAGLRLGFAIAAHELCQRLRGDLGPWAVSGPALAIGAAALRDDVWLQQARQRLAADCARLDALLMAAGCNIVGGTPLFRLAESVAAQDLADRLAQRGIHVRRFAHDETWLRFGLPGREEEWQQLADALTAS